MKKKRIEYADDDISSIKNLFKLRTPFIFLGLFLGLILSFITSRFEEVLAQNIALAFFMPLLVYLADAIGTQTQTIYTRDLRTGRSDFKKYLVKETLLGIIWGWMFSIVSALVILAWFKSVPLMLTVGVSMLLTISISPLTAVIITKIVYSYKEDPAIGSGPIATIIRDGLSIVIYGSIASAIML